MTREKKIDRDKSVEPVTGSDSNAGTVTCRQCGTCCEKGGPALHEEDRELVESGAIPLADLYTIRAGETVFDNIRGHYHPTLTDIVKIKSRNGSRACIHYKGNGSGCAVYSRRPMECRVLTCWNTRPIEKVYQHGRLTRSHLISRVKGLWELVEDHQNQCGFGEIRELTSLMTPNDNGKTMQTLRYMARYDAEIRQLAVEKGGIDPEMTDFLFGRPLSILLRSMGFLLP